MKLTELHKIDCCQLFVAMILASTAGCGDDSSAMNTADAGDSSVSAGALALAESAFALPAGEHRGVPLSAVLSPPFVHD